MADPALVTCDDTHVFPRELDRPYPSIVRGEGVWVYDRGGRAYLDAISGGAMVTSLGHGNREIIDAAYEQAKRISFVYNQQFTSPAQEELADRLIDLSPQGFTRVHFVSGGSEANETAVRLARSYHVERGDSERWRIISPAQAYHGPTMATFALTGRPGLYGPFAPYLSDQLHIPPATWRLDPTGEAALEALDQAIDEAGPSTIAAFFCEPTSAAALPAYSPPDRFWTGLDERRREHGFLVCFDEVVTGMGRTGSWFNASQKPCLPDIISTAKGLGAGYAPVGAMLCRQHVFDAVAAGSRQFEHGHTWDGAPLPCAVGSAVIDYLQRHHLVERVAERGPRLREQLADALGDSEMVGEVRGHGYLLGVDYCDPRDGRSFLPAELNGARRIDQEALQQGVLLYSTQPTSDGYAGDQTLMAPPFTSTDRELEQMVDRLAASVLAVERQVKQALAGAPASQPIG